MERRAGLRRRHITYLLIIALAGICALVVQGTPSVALENDVANYAMTDGSDNPEAENVQTEGLEPADEIHLESNGNGATHTVKIYPGGGKSPTRITVDDGGTIPSNKMPTRGTFEYIYNKADPSNTRLYNCRFIGYAIKNEEPDDTHTLLTRIPSELRHSFNARESSQVSHDSFYIFTQDTKVTQDTILWPLYEVTGAYRLWVRIPSPVGPSSSYWSDQSYAAEGLYYTLPSNYNLTETSTIPTATRIQAEKKIAFSNAKFLGWYDGPSILSGKHNFGIRPLVDNTYTIYGLYTDDSLDPEVEGGDFTLGRDNNRYRHSESNFFNGNSVSHTYTIPANLFEQLVAGGADRDDLLKHEQKKWNGSCYGIASSIALVYDDRLSLSDISSVAADSYHSLPLPSENTRLRNSINYYQLSQFTSDAPVSYDDLESYKALPILTDLLKNGRIALLSYGHDSQKYDDNGNPMYDDDGNPIMTISGHAIVAVSMRHNSGGGYTITLYDENCVSRGERFIDMTVSEDMRTFSFEDANGNAINNDTCRYMEVRSADDIFNVKPQHSQALNSDSVTLSFPMTANFTLTSGEKTLIYNMTDGFSDKSTMEILDISPVSDGEESEWIVKVPLSGTFVVSGCSGDFDLGIGNGDDYLSIGGTGFDDVTMILGDSITLNSASDAPYSFEAYISTDEVVPGEGENLIALSATAEDATTISYESADKQVVAESLGRLTNVSGRALDMSPDVKRLPDLDTSDNVVAVTTEPQEADTHTVVFDANGHGVEPAPQSVRHNGRVTKPQDPTADGWTFEGWYTEPECTNAYDFSEPVTDHFTLYAKWTKAIKSIDMYRMYNPNSGEHMYTASTLERDTMIGDGWDYESIMWKAPSTSSSPVWRLYNPNNGDHHYANTLNEYNTLMRMGWTGEKIAFYSADSDGVPVYRLYNPNQKGAGAHHYTTSISERNVNVNAGWRYEKIGWYGLK